MMLILMILTSTKLILMFIIPQLRRDCLAAVFFKYLAVHFSPNYLECYHHYLHGYHQMMMLINANHEYNDVDNLGDYDNFNETKYMWGRLG